MPVPSIVQKISQGFAGGSSPLGALAYSSNVTAGNLLLAFVSQFSGGTADGVSDTQSNTWTQLDFVTTGAGAGNVGGSFWWAKAKSTGADSVNIFTWGNNDGSLVLWEISGADGVTPINAHNAAALLAGSTSPDSGAITTTVANCLLIAACGEANNAETFTAGTGWTLDSGTTLSNPSPGTAVGVETQTAALTGTFHGAFTMTVSNPWFSAVAAIAPVQASFSTDLATIPENHAGNLNIHLIGNGANWTGGTTISVTNSTTGTTAVTKVSQSFVDSEHITLTVTTGAGVGTFTISDGTLSTTVATAAPSITSISPNTGNVADTLFCTVNSTNTVWTQENKLTLFSQSGGGSGCAIANVNVISDTEATFTFEVGQPPAGTITVEDTSTGATVPFTSTFLTIAGIPLTITNGTGSVSLVRKHIGSNLDYCLVVPSGNVNVSRGGSNAPSGSGATYRNGQAINPPCAPFEDGRIPNNDDTIHCANPVTLTAGDSLVMAVSDTVVFDPTDPANSPTGVGFPAEYATTTTNWRVGTTGGQNSFLQYKIVLTVLATDPGTDSFRPPPYGTNKPVYHASDIQRSLLKSLAAVASPPSAASLKAFYQFPQLDFVENIVAPMVAGAISMNSSYGFGWCAGNFDAALGLNFNLGWSASDYDTILYGCLQSIIDLHWATQVDNNLLKPNGGFRPGRATMIYWGAMMLGQLGNWNLAPTKNGQEYTDFYRGKDRNPVQTLQDGWPTSGNQYAANVLRNLNGMPANEMEGQSPTAAIWTTQSGNGSPLGANKNWGYCQQNSRALAGGSILLQICELEGTFGYPASFQNSDRQIFYSGGATDIASFASAATTGNWDNLDPFTSAMPLASGTTAGANTALTISPTITTTCNGAVAAGDSSITLTAGANLPASGAYTIGGDGTNPSEVVTGSISGNVLTLPIVNSVQQVTQHAHNSGSVVYPLSLAAGQIIGIAQDGTNNGEAATISGVGSTIIVNSTANNHAAGANVYGETYMSTTVYGPTYGFAATAFQTNVYNTYRPQYGTQNWNAVGGSGGGLGMPGVVLSGMSGLCVGGGVNL